MTKLNPNRTSETWKQYIVACDNAFGLPKRNIVAPSSFLNTPHTEIVLAAKFVLCGIYAADQLDALESDVTIWLEYLPRFIDDDSSVSFLNDSWTSRLRGVSPAQADADRLDAFLRSAHREGEQLIDEARGFAARLRGTVAKDDRLLFHKACILLGVDYDEPNPSLGRTIVGALFPSFR